MPAKFCILLHPYFYILKIAVVFSKLIYKKTFDFEMKTKMFLYFKYLALHAVSLKIYIFFLNSLDVGDVKASYTLFLLDFRK